MNNERGQQALPDQDRIDVPSWKRDILDTTKAFNIFLSRVYSEQNEIGVSLHIGAVFVKVLDSVRTYLPEYFLFDEQGVDIETMRKHPIKKLMLDVVAAQTRVYYLPETHQVVTIESSSYGSQTPSNTYPESEDFLGFNTITQGRGGPFYHQNMGNETAHPGVFVKNISKDPEEVRGGKIVSLPPHQARKLLDTARGILEERVGKEKTDQILLPAEEVLQEYEEQLTGLYEREAPQARARILNLRDALCGSRYRFLIPSILELSRYDSDRDRDYYYFITKEGKLVRSVIAAKRNFLRRVTEVHGVEASPRQWVEKSYRINNALTAVLPSGWGLWDTPPSLLKR